jgi:hypothetical protein
MIFFISAVSLGYTEFRRVTRTQSVEQWKRASHHYRQVNIPSLAQVGGLLRVVLTMALPYSP